MSEAERLAALERMVRASPTLMRVLEGARALALPEWRVVSGAVYQTVWNALTGREPDHGIRDYDLFYFDADPSWEAEDVWIRRAAAYYPPPLDAKVEVRNQGRVHLWFPDHFGEPYPPVACADEALARFVCPAFAVGVRLEADHRLDIAAPFGLEECFALRLRPNPNRPRARDWDRVTGSAKARWPEITVEEV